MPLNHSLLIVLPDHTELDDLSRRFIKLGLEVTSAHHPRLALGAVANREFHVALVNCNLPEMCGVELMKNLKSRVAGLRVILISDSFEPEHAEQLLAAGAFDCLMKPYRHAELERVITEAIESPIDASESHHEAVPPVPTLQDLERFVLM